MLKKTLFVIMFCSLMLVGSVSAVVGDGSGVDSYTQIPSDNSGGVEYTTTIPEEVGVQNINPSGSPLMFSPYNSTTVTLTYATSINYTVAVSSPDTRHSETSSPSGITFIAEGVSTYMLHYRILYDNAVNQTIVLTVRSGNGQTTSIPLNCYNKGFELDVIITSLTEPKYPSAEELWDYGNAQQAQTLLKMSADFRGQQEQDLHQS